MFRRPCDHLLVIDKGARALVGTYRLLRQDVAERNGGFYTEQEFDLRPLIARKGHLRFLELGRSCVLREYRTKPVIALLWRALWDYIRHHRIDVLMGCASFDGANLVSHAAALGHLARHHVAPEDWRVDAQPCRRVDMLNSPDSGAGACCALKAMPPLIKGYLRLGAFIGPEAAVDHAFDTVDVLILLPVTAIEPRYFARFGQPACS